MTPDHYATLGLSPTSEDVVIRAAYRALIRRYHPDGNASTAAAARARAINAAYEVLIDPEKRTEYDKMRAAEAWPNAPLRRSMLAGPSRWFAAASVTLLLVLVYLITWSPLSLVKPPERMAAPARIPQPAKVMPPLLPAPEPPTVAEIEGSVADPQLDEPLPEPIESPLEPLPRLTVPVAQSPAPRIRQGTPSNPPVTKSIVARPQLAVAKPETPENQPSFNCRVARTRGEIAVCSDPNLAVLDSQQAMFYSQSWLRADPAKRERLQSTRNRFMARRDRCRSIACTRTAYLARMREVSQIMIGPIQKPN